MRTLLIVAVLLLVGIAGLGFYQGWFRFSTEGTEQQPSVTITVDRDKIRADETSVTDKVQSLGEKAEEKTGDLTENVEQ